MIDWSRIH